MNSIESRIYADASEAASEIAPADIPPLRLPPRRGRPAGGPAFTGAARPAGTRRWLAPLAAAASVALIIAGLISLERGHSPAHHRTPPAARPAPAVDRPQTALAAEALDSYFPASGAQYTHGLAFNWTRFKISARIYGSCMADAGFPQRPFTEPESAFLLAFPDNSQFPDLAQRARTGTMTPASYVAPNPFPPGSAAGRRAASRCTAASNQPFTQIDKIAASPGAQWLDIVTAVQTSPAVRATQPAFATCLEAHGIPAAYAQYQTNGSNPLFGGFFDWMDHLGQTSASNSQLTAEEHRWTPVFVQCARPAVSLVERLQLERRAGFFRQHAPQISEIKTLAAELWTAR